MSRIGKKPIQIPAKVKVEINGSALKATGPLGTLSYNIPEGINAKIEGAVLTFSVDPKREEEPE